MCRDVAAGLVAVHIQLAARADLAGARHAALHDVCIAATVQRQRTTDRHRRDRAVSTRSQRRILRRAQAAGDAEIAAGCRQRRMATTAQRRRRQIGTGRRLQIAR